MLPSVGCRGDWEGGYSVNGVGWDGERGMDEREETRTEISYKWYKQSYQIFRQNLCFVSYKWFLP